MPSDRARTLRMPIPSGGLSLPHTLNCGQVFCWREEAPGAWRGWIGDSPARCHIEDKRGDPRLVVEGLDGAPPESAARRYFGIDDDLTAMIATFPDDPWMREAVAHCHGLRLVRQRPWEALACFLCSAVKQVPHIQQMDAALRSRFGESTPAGHRFPTIEAIAAAPESGLRAAGLGFRAPNLQKTARQLLDGEVSLEAIATMADDEALSELQRLRGVGPKIANCVLLFGYGRWRAFPVDTWIGKALRHLYYPRRRRLSPEFLRTVARDRFGPYAGLAQQYLFHWLRHGGHAHLPQRD